MMPSLSRRQGAIEFSAAMILSGTLGFFVLEASQSPWNVVFFRCFFGSLSLLLYCWLAGLLRKQWFTPRTLALALLGGAAIVVNWVLLFSSYHFASISVATAVYHIQPFFLVLFGALLLGERLSASTFGWLGLAFIGLLFVIKLDVSTLDLSSDILIGGGLALGAAVLYAATTLVAKQLKGVPPHLIALVQVSLGTLLLFPFADFNALPGWSSQWVYLVGIGIVHTCLMYILLYAGVQSLAVGQIAILSFLYPIVAIVVDYALYGQNLTFGQVSGVGLILLGSAGVNLKWKIQLGSAVTFTPKAPVARIKSDLT